jgi:hypothetical protein
MKISFGMTNIELTGQIHDGLCIRQEFTAEAPRLLSIEIYFATYKRENPGQIFVEIRNPHGDTLLKQVTFDSSKLEDNSFREFAFDIDLLVGQNYELKIYTKHCRAGYSPTAMHGNRTAKGSLFVGARLIRGKELQCIFNYEGTAEKNEIKRNTFGVRPTVLKDTVEGMISVVIPHYNCQEYLPKCLASLAKQTYSCMEVIVVDDGSKQKAQTKKIVESFQPMLPALQFVQLKKNSGAPAARNAGARLARGEYIYFCDSDIELYPESLEVLVRMLLEDLGAAFSYGGFIWGVARVEPIEFDRDKLRNRNYVTTNSLVRRSECPEWDERLQRHQDWDLWLSVLDNGGRGVCCDRFLFETPVRKDGISNDSNIGMKDSMAIVRKKHNL